MVFDAYVWSKDKLRTLVNKIDLIKNDGELISPGQIWSIKKLLALDYCIEGFVTIFRKHFKKWYYVDTHCGSGLIGFEEDEISGERFPGSPVIAALRSIDYPFTDYILSDIDIDSITALIQRLRTLRPVVGSHAYNPQVRSFEDSVILVESMQKYGTSFLIFIDPQGFSEIKWNLMERLLRIRTADIFFTFMTPYIAMHRTNAESNTAYETTLNEFFGDQTWRSQSNGSELLDRYIEKIRQFKDHVFDIPVFRTGESRLYDLIIATNSKGAGNIVDDARKVMEITSTEMIRDAFKVVTNKRVDLSKWFK